MSFLMGMLLGAGLMGFGIYWLYNKLHQVHETLNHVATVQQAILTPAQLNKASGAVVQS